ncbi:acetyl-CoA carboxylase biotin carboxylase subunit [Luteibaculum oceani]|uniref:Acetyl-CoA carboxylase biotin carboxylase subunit n=1 Tax=Luteibaculum oceani TaxID=1294296 RepID=A0A5C6VFF1_9FLAO|nr:acetyl-CoA carboxylase biotin carboxylase subunit [Luteibaculum oceani]TXC82038.1 acetyl-CoA carboxylase biotin carboxylase subunit [Luteibaculum oceani]
MKKILVANRGEIALRVMRSAKDMDIKTVAVFSDADRNAPFVRFADEAYHIGPSPSKHSYLNIDKIIEVAQKAGVDGIHPGYGFLSENAVFADKVAEAGITFIGPKSKSMEVMGSKLAAKDAVKNYNIPLVPGSDGAISDVDKAIEIAKEIGFPILVKASAGGGGKGMRIVESVDEVKSGMERAISEAESAFGDGAVFIEKFVGSPRHIEIQVLADTHGNCVYLFERECSVQRRHQKVIEEAPSAVLTPELRKQMGEAAVKVAKACDYIGAGTVEFLVDEKLNFYFLEMNTRLQVEHPVTEMITGVDLVQEQIKVARGEKLSFSQEDLSIQGHSIEVRVYAEDPANNFLPDIGKLETYRIPKGPGIRVDDGFEEGMEIPIHYDPMIAKLIVHANTRDEAIARMLRAIEAYRITGIETTLPFCSFTLKHEAFRSGNFDTNFVKHHFTPDVLKANNEDEMAVASMLAPIIFEDQKTKVKEGAHLAKGEGVSTWKLKR